jgi:DNA-binding MarR family transcriptional regulator
MANPRWLSTDEQRAWRAYLRMVLLADAEIARDLSRDSGLSMPDYQVLTALSESADHQQRLSELATAMQWSPSRLSHHVSRMEQRGLVGRMGCDEDARGAFVVLTELGLRAIEAAAPNHVASVRAHLIDVLTPAQVAALADIGETVIAHFGESCPKSYPSRPGAGSPGQSANRSPVSLS